MNKFHAKPVTCNSCHYCDASGHPLDRCAKDGHWDLNMAVEDCVLWEPVGKENSTIPIRRHEGGTR